MAGAGFRTFVAGEVLTAAQVNTYLMEQAVMTFADAAARDAAVTSPSEGMVAFLKDTDQLVAYDGTNWNLVVKQQLVTFTSSGTFTKASYPWARHAVIYCIGPGGAGGGADQAPNQADASCGSGGGAGGVAIKYVEMSALGASETVTVGTGGAGSAGADGFDGSGDTSFGTHCHAGYGRGGKKLIVTNTTVYQLPGGGYTAGPDVGDIIIEGQMGGNAQTADSTHATLGLYKAFFTGRGGDTIFGTGGGNQANGAGSASGPGAPGQGYGAGGSGAFLQDSGAISAKAGGNGADGAVLIELYS